MFSQDERVKYYTQNITKKKITITKDMLGYLLEKTFVSNLQFLKENCDCIMVAHIPFGEYFIDLYKYINLLDNNELKKKSFLSVFGDTIDHNPDYPVLCKVRKIQDMQSSTAILNINALRHSGMLQTIKNIDIPFNKKNNKLLWRGVSTGRKHNLLRDILVKKFQNNKDKNIDIKFSRLLQGYEHRSNEYILGAEISIEKQLESKFLISIEGNDVATNLKWCLLSNSVVLMPKPKICSWFMEDKLEPFVHYIPLQDDFEDLIQKYDWCLSNLSKCEEISKNATRYMEQFMNEKNENEIAKRVVIKYLENIELIIPVEMVEERKKIEESEINKIKKRNENERKENERKENEKKENERKENERIRNERIRNERIRNERIKNERIKIRANMFKKINYV
jgi:hypothetical protein